MNCCVQIAVFFLICNQFLGTNSLNSQCPKLCNGRLSRNVIPNHYDLNVNLDLETLKFNGTVIVSIDVKRDTKTITLHAKDLVINSAQFNNSTATNITYCKYEDTVSLHFSQSIGDEGKLQITYTGNVPNYRATGIYALRNKSCEDVRYSVYTDFEPINARRAFPCFDEPNLKATFSISITTASDRTILSNMPPLQNISISENTTKIVFQTTPKMSTYIVCFIVGDFDFVEQQSIDQRVRLRVYTPIGRRHEGSFALSLAVKSLDFLQNYTGFKFPLPKIDMVPLRDYSSGAMENWGLYVFIETALLSTEKSSVAHLQEIAKTMCHEMAHQWFGNLVTPDWWTNAWLSEGFATFFEHLVTNVFYPQWKLWDYNIYNHYSFSMDKDSLRNSHSISLKSFKQHEAIDIGFDAIVYSKGFSIIRMMWYWIGAEEFKKGLNVYLNKYQYGNSNTKKLLTTMAYVSRKPVRRVLNNWFTVAGYPYLKVLNNETCERGELQQQRFLFDDSHGDEIEKIWKIPVSFSTCKNESNVTTMIMTHRTKLFCKKCICNWNDGPAGYYRVQYSSQQYQKLFSNIKNGNVSSRQRFSLQNDYFAFAKSGKESIVEFLKHLKQYRNEDEYYVWKSIGDSLGEISALLSDTNCSKGANDYIRDLMSVIKQKMDKSTSTDDLTTLLRVFVYLKFGLLGDENIVNDAFKKFEDYYNNNIQIDENYRPAIFQIVASNSSDENYNKLIEIFKRNHIDANLQEELAFAFGSSSKPNQLQSALDFSLTCDVTISDSVKIITSVSVSVGRDLAWNFFKQNFNIYKKRIEGSTLAGNLISGIVKSFSSSEKADEIERFFSENKFQGSESSLRMSLEVIRNKEKWYKRDASAICDYIKTQ